MALLLAQVSLPYESGLPEDQAVNTWTFNGGTDEASTTAIGVGLVAFYQAITDYISEVVVRNQCSIKLYNTADPEPRTPIAEDLFDLTGVGANPLPEEVALCLSFRGALVSGEAPARRRGRVYLGPLTTTSMAEDTDGHVRPVGGWTGALNDGVVGLRSALTSASVQHVVWSRAGASFTPAVHYWYDNAPDTQRRRGPRPTQRTTVLTV